MNARRRGHSAVLVAALLLADCGGRAPAARAVHAAAAARSAAISIVPQPRGLQRTGGTFIWPARVRLDAGEGAAAATQQLRAFLAANGVFSNGDASAYPVALRVAPHRELRLGDEGYALDVGADGVVLRANAPAGLLYGVQTLVQLCERRGGTLVSPAASVVDWPEYRWRGLQLDAARHFFPVAVIKRTLDVAARYKLNTFQWHLTDDQAWRLPLSRYPHLGARTPQYSPAEMRAVVAYARQRFITIVPEIEMPAHAAATLRAYPSLACAGGTLCTTGAGLAFARTALDRTFALFPGRVVHVGGDEVPAVARGAQPAFTAMLASLAAAHGRRIAGWDDFASTTTPRSAIVTVWTDRRVAPRLARRGYDVVLASGALYFDAVQGDAAQEPRGSPHMVTLENVYDDEPLAAGFGASSRHLLGVQANLWTEHVATEQRLFAMLLPRTLALAEIAWSPRSVKRWDGFVARLPAQFAWLDAHGYPFRVPNVSFTVDGASAFTAIPSHVQDVDAWTSRGGVTIRLSVPIRDAVIRYTTDGSAPSAASRAYRVPLRMIVGTVPLTVRAAAFHRSGRGAASSCTVRNVAPDALQRIVHPSSSWASLVSP